MDGMMDSHELGPVRECSLDLNIGNHFRHSLHHVFAAQDPGAILHQFGDRLTIPDGFQNLCGNQRHRFRMVQFQASGTALARQIGSCGDEKLLNLSWRQMHSCNPVFM